MAIALIDDHTIFVESIKNLLKRHGFNDVNSYTNALTFLNENGTVAPDVIILDIMMPNINGLKLLEICRDLYKGNSKIIILSSVADVHTIRQAIKNGASAFLSKSISVQELIEAITSVINGSQYIEKSLSASLFDSIFIEENIVFHLSPREKQIINEISN